MKIKNSDYVKDQSEKERKNHPENVRVLTIEEQIDQFVKILVNTYLKLENEKSNKCEE